MQWRALSTLWNLSDPDLVNLHDRLHELVNSNSDPVRWYHAQVVETMKERGLVHYHVDGLDTADVPDLPLELQTHPYDGHQHTAMLDEYGDGFTDPVEGHYHLVNGGKVVAQDGHVHDVTGTFQTKAAKDDAPLGDTAITGLTKMAKGVSMAGGRVGESEGHTHLALVFDTDSGFGETSFDSGHVHWILDWTVQEVDGHTHDLALRNLVEVNGIFQAVEQALDGTPSNSSAESQATKTHRPDDALKTFSAFGEPGVLEVKTHRCSSAGDAWELWETENIPILITPAMYGLDLQAHIKVRRGVAEVALFIGNKDVSQPLRQIRESLKIINVARDCEVVLAGVLTTRRDRDNALTTLPGVLSGQTKDHVAAFYVEDCWWFDKSLKGANAFDRRRLVEQLLANSTTPALKQMQRAFVAAGDKRKAVRVTEKIREEEGNAGVRWRNANADFATTVEEIIVR